MNDIVLDHVAIAVTNLDQSQKVFQDLGFSFGRIEMVKSEQVKTSFCKVDQFANIELLEPMSPQSAVDKYIQSKGEGLHHLCFKVKNLTNKIQELKELGYKFIYDQPKVGAHNKLINFIHPKSSQGVLIELSQDQN